MDDLSVIDRFLNVFSRYIDSGFGLLGGEVAFLTATLVVIDMTLAGLFWAMGGDDVLGKLIKKTLYVGAFAYIIGNFNALAGIVFRSFAGLGLMASGSTVTQAEFLQPGRLAHVGVEAGRPILQRISEMSGFPEMFLNMDSIIVLVFAWIVVIVSFFVLAVQLFVTLIEFKLTTLAGFVLVPFALWNKTAFLAERVLGNVISAGIKVLVLAVIVGIGSSIFGEFQLPPGTEPTLEHALTIMLASLAMFALGIFGPGIATGLVSGAPQLGAGAAAGAVLGAGGLAVAGGAAVATGGAAVAAGTRMAAGGATGAARSVNAMASSARSAYQAGAAASGATGLKAAGAGLANVARSGSAAIGRRVATGVQGAWSRMGPSMAAPPTGPAASTTGDASPASTEPPHWAQRLQRNQHVAHGVSTAAHVLRSSDHGGGGISPNLRDESDR